MINTHTVTPLVTMYTHTRNTHHHKDEMRALMEVASFITASPLIPCYPTNLVITTSPRVIEARFRPLPLIMTVTPYA